jgi:hypothetical protein
MDRLERPTYITVADAGYFIGAVAMLNSLRLTGNEGDVVVVDRGLSPEQRAALKPQARILDLTSEDRAKHAYFQRQLVYRYGLEGILVFIDSDMLITNDLSPIVEQAAAGKVVVYPNHPSGWERFFPEWAEVFELEAPLRRQRYANAGLVAFSTEHWPTLLARWERACAHIDPARIFDGNWHQPFWAGDQDALNALLMSEIPPDSIAEGDQAETLLFDSVNDGTIEDERTLRLTYRDVPVRFIHYGLSPKAWQPQGWRRIREDDTYALLLPRVLFGDDVAVPLRRTRVPLWVRPGAVGRMALVGIGSAHTVGSMIARRDLAPIGRQLRALSRRILPGKLAASRSSK